MSLRKAAVYIETCRSFRRALAELGVEMVVAASPLNTGDRQPFDSVGWPQDRLLSYVTDRPACRGMWAARGGWLATRRPWAEVGRRDAA